ncbi:MAG: DUF1874 domain-containing protein [Clostridia bacterium]|nr:DUF1874 domain-containing protein [Clostridia bacterium]
MIYLCNTFSPRMLPRLAVGEGRKLTIERMSAADAGRLLRNTEFVSIFGHGWSAWHLSRYLQLRIPANRRMICLGAGDELIVAEVVNRNRCTKRIEGCPKWVFYRVVYSPESPSGL